MRLSILIVNYNTETFIEKFLLDLKQQTLPPEDFEIIITNNVQNETLKSVISTNTELQGLNIQIVESPRNVGFGRAMNLAADHASGQELLIANPDLRMLQNNYLAELLHQSAQHPDYGIITTRVLNDDQKDTSEYGYYEFEQDLGFKNQTNWFCGALMLIHHEFFNELKGFDPDFFMYCEDEDLCLRIKQREKTLVKINELSIYHKGGSSEPYKNYAFYHRWFKSKILFAYKHFNANDFVTIMNMLEKKSQRKSMLYATLSLTGSAKYKERRAKWNAMRDCITQTRVESAQWLYFK